MVEITKIRVSYEKPGELERIMRLLEPLVKSAKVKHEETGPYKRVYITYK